MEEEKKKRWSVTYTKHIKQKRKIYEDGFLDLQISTNKLMLLDESEKLLECRMLKNDEAVCAAQTLSFASYLVDVGLLHTPPPSAGTTATTRNTSTTNNPINLRLRSPSQKIIREFKKRQVQKYGAAQTGPTSPKTSLTAFCECLIAVPVLSAHTWKEIIQWAMLPTINPPCCLVNVLYTTQLTQKSKNYHDGFLQLSVCGSLGRKVMLFDEYRKPLESSFLKKGVVIRSGESISLHAHSVEIGECKGSNDQTDGKLGIAHLQKNQFESDGTSGKEWQVMYTTQVTQKAKKYHDGFLKLTNSGKLQRQIMLYDGSKKLINSRFVKKDEVIQSGESVAFDAHLVDIGEAEGNYQGSMNSDVCVSSYNIAGKTELMNKVQNHLKTSESFLKGKPKKIACSKEYGDPKFSISNIDEKKLSQNISANRPLRDATQILSILQKPLMHGCLGTGSIDKSIMNPVPSTKDHHNSDCTRNIPECTRNIPECSQLPRISVAHHGPSGELNNVESSECVGNIKSRDLYSKGLDSVAKSSCSGNKSSQNAEVGKLHQPHLDNLELYPKQCNEPLVPGSSSPTGRACHETVDLTNNSVELEISRESGRFPSFDLGFD